MGDFEDVFGAGADAVDIIEGFSRAEMRYQMQAALKEEEEEQCRNPKVASSFFELTGQTWIPSDDCRDSIFPEDEDRLRKMARMHAKSVGLGVDYRNILCLSPEEEISDYARALLEAMQEAFQRDLRTLDEIEFYLGEFVSALDMPALFVRMTGLKAGFAGPALSTHAVVLEHGIFLARFGDLVLRGPFPQAAEDFSGHKADQYRSLFHVPPGAKVLAISQVLTDPEHGIIDAQSWVDAERGSEVYSHEQSAHDAAHSVWADLTREAGNHERQGHVVRSWTDGELHHLTKRLRRLIAPLIDDTYEGRLVLRAGLSGESYLKLTRMRWRSPSEELINHLLSMVDVRHFVLSTRYLGQVDVPLLNYPADGPSMHEKLSGKEDLVSFLSSRGYDRGAISAHLTAGDFGALANFLNPEELRREVVRRRAAAERQRQQDQVRQRWQSRTGLKDLPY